MEGSWLGALTSKYDPMAACKFLQNHLATTLPPTAGHPPIVHVQEERRRGVVQLGPQQLLQLLHELVPVRGPHAAELLQQGLLDVHVAVVGRVRFHVVHVHRGRAGDAGDSCFGPR